MADKAHAPNSLKFQWRLYGLVARSDWATGLDKSVAFEIIDNYRKEHGNSRASLSFLCKATGSGRRHVHASTQRLVERGPFSILRLGVGTRPTEYKLHFELVAEEKISGTTGGTAATTISTPISGGGESHSGTPEGTTCSSPVGTANPASGTPEGTQTDLPVAAYSAGVRVGGTDKSPAAASPPPLPGAVGADGVVPARVGFEEFWGAYPRKHDRRAAKEAYSKLNPSPELHARIVRAAAAWTAHYETNDTDKKWMPTAPNSTRWSVSGSISRRPVSVCGSSRTRTP